MRPWLLALLLAGAAWADSSGFQASYERMKSGIVLIVVESPLGVGSGSGFVVGRTEQGPLVVTNHHVVENASRMQVVANNHDQVSASTLADDPEHDLALVQASRENPAWSDTVSALELAPEDTGVPEGTDLAVVGYPLTDSFVKSGLGVSASVSRGIVSALRTTEHGPLYQTDAEVNPGNSGGPAFLWDTGQVVGVTVAKFKPAASVNFIIPLPTLRAFLQGRLPEEPTPTPTPLKRKAPARVAEGPPLTVILGAFVAVALVALGIGAFLRRPGPPPEEPSAEL